MKLKIALRNLFISQAIILIFLIFAYCFWFPHSFEKLGGFYKTALMLIFVDLVLGPCLVYFIYKENKKYLLFDINVLLSIQLIAFVFGAYSLYLKHPAFAVFSVDRFVLTNVSNITPRPSWTTQIKQHVFSSPKFVVARLPDEPEEKNFLTLNVILNGQADIDSRPKYFVPFNMNVNTVMNKSIQIEKLVLNQEEKEQLKLFTEKHQSKAIDLAFFPLRGNNQKDVLWVFDKASAKPLGILDIDPWNFKVATNSLSK